MADRDHTVRNGLLFALGLLIGMWWGFVTFVQWVMRGAK